MWLAMEQVLSGWRREQANPCWNSANLFDIMDLKNSIDILFMFSFMVNIVNFVAGTFGFPQKQIVLSDTEPCKDLSHLRDFNDLRDYVYQVSFV